MFIAEVLSVVQNDKYPKWLMHRGKDYFYGSFENDAGLVFEEGKVLIAKDD